MVCIDTGRGSRGGGSRRGRGRAGERIRNGEQSKNGEHSKHGERSKYSGPGGVRRTIGDKKHGSREHGRGTASVPIHSKVLDAGDSVALSDGFYRHHWIQDAHEKSITAICVATDAVYTTSADGSLKRWRPHKTDDNLYELVAEMVVLLGDPCWCMAHANQWLFCGLSTGPIRAFCESGKDVTLSGHSQGVSAMVVHQGVLLSGSAEGTVRGWQWTEQAGSFVNSHTVDNLIPSQVRSLAVMNDQLWVGGATGVTVVELATLGRAVQLQPDRKVAALLEFQSHMIATFSDGSVCIYDGNGGTTHSQPALKAGSVIAVTGLECGPRVLFGHGRGEISSIELPSFALKCSWKGVLRKIRSLCSARHDGLFIMGAEDGSLHVWQRSPDQVQASSITEQTPLQPLQGAPCCQNGHVCVASDFAEGRYAKGWKCSICRTAQRGERWFCAKCNDDLCFECFPKLDSTNKKPIENEAIVVNGRWLQVSKHSTMGCAVITFKDKAQRDRLIEQTSREPPVIGGIQIEVKVHMEKQPGGGRKELPLCAFAGWKQPKTPGAGKLSARTLQVYLDRVCDSLSPTVNLD